MILPIQNYKYAINKNTTFSKARITKTPENTSYNTNLKYKWQDILSKLQIPKDIIDFEFNNLSQAYNKPQRHYHNLSHIEKMLKEVDGFKINNPNAIKEPDILDFAIFMHDIVNGEENDVEKSADIACRILNKSSSFQIKNKKNLLREIIFATKHNKSLGNNSLEAKIIADADLAILGANEFIYDSYAQKIRKEYSQYNNEEFKIGRIKVLDMFLNKFRIYSTDYFKDKYEIHARKNLIEEKIGLNKI